MVKKCRITGNPDCSRPEVRDQPFLDGRSDDPQGYRIRMPFGRNVVVHNSSRPQRQKHGMGRSPVIRHMLHQGYGNDHISFSIDGLLDRLNKKTIIDSIAVRPFLDIEADISEICIAHQKRPVDAPHFEDCRRPQAHYILSDSSLQLGLVGRRAEDSGELPFEPCGAVPVPTNELLEHRYKRLPHGPKL